MLFICYIVIIIIIIKIVSKEESETNLFQTKSRCTQTWKCNQKYPNLGQIWDKPINTSFIIFFDYTYYNLLIIMV